MIYQHPWVAKGSDLTALAKLLKVERNEIKINKTLADEPAEECHNCGRQVGLLDIAETAFSLCAHSGAFLKNFFMGKEVGMESPEGLKHRVHCHDCGEIQNVRPGWATGFSWTYDDPDPPTQDDK